MIKVDENDLTEILMDLDSMSALLTVMESSDYYKGTEDDKVCRALRNSVEYTKSKLRDIIEDAKNIENLLEEK